MIGTRQMERVLAEVEKRRAKVVLVGDPEQLQAIEAGAAFRSVAERHGTIEITDIHRQREDWQRLVTRQFATERTDEALDAYRQHDAIHAAGTREAARAELIECWDRQRQQAPRDSRIILTHTNDEVAALNRAARGRLRTRGELGEDVTLQVEKGDRQFAAGDRVMFGRNERSLGVKNGSLGRIESVSATRVAVLLDNGRAVAFDLKDYSAVDHGYAATIHKSQGVTVDRVHVLATPGLDRHAAYVALSRHRDSVELYHGRDDFADHGKLIRALSRERANDMASDYAPAFAARRQIMLPAPAKEQRQAPKRDMFAGLKLRVPPELAAPHLPPPDPATALSQAVKRHAVIVREMRLAHSIGTPYTAEQRQALIGSRAALDALRPHARIDLETALAKDQGLIAEAAEGRTGATIRAMRMETDLRCATEDRADKFVRRWQALERQRGLLIRKYETAFANEVGDRMIGMAKSLERDPQVESILRNRRAQLGLPEADGRSVGQSLAEMIGRGRSRGLGIGM